ncbi:MAG: PBP1A family penicillin-binding protein [bacterium]|nr:PBP1A family penicillin-binding protein [bacterium]
MEKPAMIISMNLSSRKRKKRWKKTLLFASAAIFFFLLLLVIFAATINLPDIANYNERKIVQSTKIYDRTGKILLYDVHGEEKRTVIPFEEIPKNIKNATIALEDDSFYRHYGFRPLSFIRAVINNTLHGSYAQGGSTITQQVVKNTLLTGEKTVTRKLKEIILAFKLERKYSKDEILNLYLNQIPYGSGTYGIEAASQTFFGKHAKDLTTLEAAYLASTPNAPSYYSPYGKHVSELDARAKFTLKRMNDLGHLTKEEYEAALKDKIKFSPARTQGIIAPHFVIEVRDELNKRFGEDDIATGGFKVITTLDTSLQQKVEEVVKNHAGDIEKSFNAHNEGVVAIDPKTGDILAMMGSRDYFDTDHEGNFNITTAHRQPGSSIKPFVYATAFKEGLTPETTVFDVPTEFNPSCDYNGVASPGGDQNKCYHPQNYDEKFRGPISLREALAQSLNVPSVKVLYLAGLNNALSTIKDFGITSLDEPDRYGLTLVLGGGEVSLLELTSAYGVFANDSVRNSSRYILRVENSSGQAILQSETSPTEVIDKNISRAITDILSDNKARGSEFGTALEFPGKKVSVKTGTTNNYRDAWIVGYTPDIVIGAWAGNNNNTPMEKKIAGFIVAPWWHEIMDYALAYMPPSGDFVQPEPFKEDKPYLRGEWRGGQEFIIDKISGKLATEYTPKETQEKRVVKSVHSELYWIDPQSPQFNNWEASVRRWAQANGYFDETSGAIPTSYDDIHIPENLPKITGFQISPQKNSYSKNDGVVVKILTANKFPLTEIDYYLNDEFAGSAKEKMFDMVMSLNNAVDGENTIKVKIYDSIGNTVEDSTIFNIEN